MLLVNVFNQALRKVPAIENGLEDLIRVQGWDTERTQHAFEIISQLKKASLCNSNPPTLTVRFEPLYLTLVSTEIEKISKEWNMDEIKHYVEELIADINKLSSEIQFSYGGHDYDESVCEIEIDWYI